MIRVISFLLTLVQANQYPIVLVHGFMGWGREEMLGMKYWGGIQGDLQEILQNDGHQVFTAAVGPLSSNWDRACELYTQIRGGRVDYGEAHAEKYGHHRYGRTYPGLYPEWGTKDENGEIRKVHFIAHSMGGQTVRVLARLLKHGTLSAPVDEFLETDDVWSLFGGDKDWIHSITTIATPHEGSIISDGFTRIGNEVKSFLAGLISIGGVVGDHSKILYDVKMDQWDIGPKESNESLTDYMHRVFSSPIFKLGYEDLAMYDLSTLGAAKLNEWVPNEPNIYYFSYATRDSYGCSTQIESASFPVQKPHRFSMLWPLQPLSWFIGGTFTTLEQKKELNWQPNDGVINTISMHGTSDVPIVEFNGEIKSGRWHRMPMLNRTDHGSVLGFTILKDMIETYKYHATLLQTLPIAASRRLARGSDFFQADGDLVRKLSHSIQNMTDKMNSIHSKADLQRECSLSPQVCLTFLKQFD